MNSGRTKYTTTPTYGMQRRGFGKKKAEKQSNTDVDFNQKPTPDFDAQISGPTDPYAVPQGIYQEPIPQQGGIPYQAPVMPNQGMGGLNGIPAQSAGVQNGYPTYGGYNDPYNGMGQQPVTGAPMPMMPPLVNATQPMQETQANSSRAQGYVPPKVMRAVQTAPQQMQQQQGNFQQPQPGYQQPPANYQQPQAGYPQGNYPPQNGSYQTFGQDPYFAQAPMNQQGGYGGYGSDGQPPMQQQPSGKPPVNIDNWLKMLLYIILPVTFVLCIALPSEFDIIRYLFMTACAASVGMMWYRQSFGSSLRTGMTIGYGLMCIVVIVMMSSSNSDLVQNEGTITAQPTIVVTDEPSAEALGYSADAVPETTAPAETLPEETEAGQRLSSFMDNWEQNQVESMLNYTLPSWQAKQDDAATALFIIIANRTPLSYSIESISGDASDTSRSVTMTATIDKNNGNDPVKYRFLILMDQEDGEWYVDPNSLSTNDTDDDADATDVPSDLEAIFTLAPRMTVSPVPPDDTVLYYNPSGGSYYHAVADCSAVNSKYLPLATFYYGQLDEEPYADLEPCLDCQAPSRPDE